MRAPTVENATAAGSWTALKATAATAAMMIAAAHAAMKLLMPALPRYSAGRAAPRAGGAAPRPFACSRSSHRL